MDEELRTAIDAMAKVLGDGMTASYAGPRFTCSEAEVLAEVLRAAGYTVDADVWIKGHASEDEEGDLHFEEPNAAESLARVTGSVGAKVCVERREADGSLTTLSTEEFRR